MIKKIKFSIPGLPISINHTYSRRGKFVFILKPAKEYMKRVRKIARVQPRFKDSSVDVRMGIIYYFPDLRRRDVHNWHHGICNALEGICYEDDKQITEITLKKRVDSFHPRVEVTLWIKN